MHETVTSDFPALNIGESLVDLICERSVGSFARLAEPGECQPGGAR